MFVIYLTVPLSARSLLSTTPHAVHNVFNLAMFGHVHASPTSRQSNGPLVCNFPGILGSNTSRHNTIALARIDLPLLRPHVQIDGTNKLEERIVIRLWFSFFQPLVPPDQQTHKDLDLLQCEVKANAHPLASGETDSAS